ncbi:hypothetical protein LNAOJCKE_1477 [Methylorubrum aminovorans]|uniref:Bacteriophage T5 Orf172 DNA-binding domain-containing protein n=1 Tax=Methylorubrum aminovorans TaxID=269069 RepID=A0ABQ4UAH9_9HYPH|nr:GIY-YIG nuclease family protein [Methylorubrum aminovorans]GJE64276.1 hypothetical protein LNAOJCKE_1477 [Methylorubrum aminovorans]GMA76680.1 hypothetical protein GCM10025880_30970 [Methylorubrum aminovorans]
MPVEVHEKWGFGMAPPKPATMAERRAAARLVLDLLQVRLPPEPSAVALDAVSTTKGMFTRIFKEDQWDWFTVMGQLGYPSRGLAEAISKELTFLRSAIRDADATGFLTALINLHRLSLRQCLKVFLGELTIKEEPGAGWLYVLSTREWPDLLKVGKTERTLQERAAEINRATGVPIPFGVRRCWRVMNPALVERRAHECLADFRLRGDREFFRIGFHEAARRLGDMIRADGHEIRTLGNLSHLAA